MAWTYEQRFNTLTAGDLNGQDSWGSGTNNTRFDVQTSVLNEGIKAVECVQPGDSSSAEIYRATTGTNVGTVYVSIRRTVANRGDIYVKLMESTSAKMYVGINSAGNIVLLAGAGFTPVTIQGGASADTWYRIGIDFDNVGQPNQYRANVNNGTFTGWEAVTNTSYTNINGITLSSSNAAATVTDYFDTFSPDYIPVVNVYTLNADVGAFTLTGVSAVLSRLYTIVASVGTFVLTSIDTTLTYSQKWIKLAKNSSTMTNQTKN